jgi:predicted helicase
MSQLLIQQYLNQLATLKRVSGTTRESVVREAFKDLLKGWARQHDLVFIPEHEIASPTKERRYVDGALMHTLRVPFGYWEAKDEKDDLDAEIEFKFRRGYPKTNIIFEDSETAVLIQHGEEVMRCGVEDVNRLEQLLKLFFGYERPEIEAFRKAVEQFKQDLPEVLKALREMIEQAHAAEPKFRKASEAFLKHARDAINPGLTAADVREMLIQHVLTGEVFAAVFPGTSYHQDNNIARELHKLEDTFFTGNTRFQALKGLAPYYTAIRKAASEIADHHEKQTFLKAIYENFYKVYNPKAADRLGVVYTPNEIVRFMIESADWLCEKHFKRNLIDKDVEILDPATGTGTFICELLEHFRGQPAKLRHKYLHELHANEVAILPYYVANLNIEATYAAIAGEYIEFPSLCLVDTLDNTHGLRKYAGHMDDIFGGVSDENVGRIRRQNSRRISVIIGNPPYNANQLNENENNKNREYPDIDKRIRETYIAESTAQKTKLYDMYARFFRWASDRLDANCILAFISNRSFIDSRTFDGFRKVLTQEFNEIYVVDLGGDVRANPKLSGTKHNVFGIQTGVAISFLVKRSHVGKPAKGCRIHYVRRPEMETAEEKLAFLSNAKIANFQFEEVRPDTKHNWVDLTNNDFDSLIPVASRFSNGNVKDGKAKAIFGLSSLGISTNRDEWLYDIARENLEKKVAFFVENYEAHVSASETFDTRIKWSETLKRRANAGIREGFLSSRVRRASYRPFCSEFVYQSSLLIDRPSECGAMFPLGRENTAICFTDVGSQKPFMAGAADGLVDLHFVGAAAGTECLPFFLYSESGERVDNITDWSLDQFRKHYQPGRGKKDRPITKEAIFHYVYAVLHDPVYREKYAINLKREFPRIPFYADFWQWADWGKTLMDLHIGYENVEPWNISIANVTPSKPFVGQPKAMLRANRDTGTIQLDELTILGAIPSEAWDYRLGNRSALEWILDQYKEKTPKDPTIREKFNTYRFADYKEKVIDLIARVTTVSVRTVEITTAMKKAAR